MASSSRHRQPRLPPAPSIASISKNSQQHVSLSKRLLFPQLSSTSNLPPLFLSPSIPPELTSELYDLIAFALRAFVNPWWSKITRYDKEFLPEITRILTLVLRALETRVLAMDLSPLVFRDICTLATQHYRDYRNVETKLGTSYASGGAISLPHLFHQLQPHMAIYADGRIDEEYFRQILDHCLKTLLPPEDYQSDAERYIIREIALKVVLQDIIPKISQPWFIHKTILDLLGPEHGESVSQKSPELIQSLSTNTTRSSPSLSTSFSFHNILIIVLSAIQSLSSTCLALIHAYKQTLSTIKLVNQTHTPMHNTTPAKQYPSPSPSPKPLSAPRISPSTSGSSSVSTLSLRLSTLPANHTPSVRVTPPVNDFSSAPLVMVSEIFTTHERFASSVILNGVTMLSASMTPFLDRLLPHLLNTALSPQYITRIARIAKRTLFPNGYLVPSPPDPTPEEQRALKERLLKWRPRGALSHLTPFLLGPEPEITLSAALDPLSSAPCNVHLVVLVLDRVLSALFPELGAGVDVLR